MAEAPLGWREWPDRGGGSLKRTASSSSFLVSGCTWTLPAKSWTEDLEGSEAEGSERDPCVGFQPAPTEAKTRVGTIAKSEVG